MAKAAATRKRGGAAAAAATRKRSGVVDTNTRAHSPVSKTRMSQSKRSKVAKGKSARQTSKSKASRANHAGVAAPPSTPKGKGTFPMTLNKYRNSERTPDTVTTAATSTSGNTIESPKASPSSTATSRKLRKSLDSVALEDERSSKKSKEDEPPSANEVNWLSSSELKKCLASYHVKCNNCKNYKELVELTASSCFKPTDIKPIFMVLSVQSGIKMSNVDMKHLKTMRRAKKELSRICVEIKNMRSNVDEGQNVPREVGIAR